MNENTEFIEEKLGQRLQRIRKLNNVTQAEMASACGMSKNHISALERGMYELNAATLINYAKKLNISIDELVGFTPETTIIPVLKNFLADLSFEQQKKILISLTDSEKKSPVIPQLQEALCKATPVQQKKLLDILRILQE